MSRYLLSKDRLQSNAEKLCPNRIKIGEVFRNCCGSFNAKEVLVLASNTEFAERVMRSGVCPRCNSFVVEVSKKYYNGRWVHEVAKRKKALKLYEKYRPDIVGEFSKSIKTGNRSNMGFRYGLNIEVVTKTGESTIKRYAVDFNGTKELLQFQTGGANSY